MMKKLQKSRVQTYYGSRNWSIISEINHGLKHLLSFRIRLQCGKKIQNIKVVQRIKKGDIRHYKQRIKTVLSLKDTEEQEQILLVSLQLRHCQLYRKPCTSISHKKCTLEATIITKQELYKTYHYRNRNEVAETNSA